MKSLFSTDMRYADVARWLFRESAGVRWRVAMNALLGVFNVGCSLTFVWISKQLVDMATHRVEGSFVAHIALLIGVLLMQLILSSVSRRMDASTSLRFANGLRSKLFSHLLHSRWDGRERFHTGDMVNRLETDVATATSLVCATIPSVVITLVRLVGAFLFLALLDLRLAAAVVVIMPVALIASKLYMKRTRRLTREIREIDSNVQSHLQEYLQHRTLVATFERTADVASGLDNLQGDLYSRAMSRANVSVYSRAVVQLGFMGGYCLTFLWGVSGLYAGIISFGMMTAFLQLVAQVQNPVVDLSRRVPAFIQGAVSVERLQEILSLPLEDEGEAVRFASSAGVKFSNVTFAYPDASEPILKDFTHDFTPGSVTALAGETGAGKSTMLRLMLALLHPQAGKIEFYDANCSAVASPMTRCNVVYVPQGNTLVSGTVRQNLQLANPQASDDDMRRALHDAVADFVLAMPDGLDTMCGERGAGLSEGQAQRIAIARGLLRNGSIMVLDEPTSALDADTEQLLMQRLSASLSGKTVIIVSHRIAPMGLPTASILRI